MLTLIKNAQVYAPNYLGTKQLLIADEKILEINDEINISYKDLNIIDLKGAFLLPGIVDRHIHITGGGGEAGFKSKVPEVKLSTLIKAGITSVVGLLGTDCISRNVESVLAKAKGLNELGMNAYAHTGGYEYPSPTITGSIKKDIAFFSEIIGTKIALSDHRDSAISPAELARLALDTRVGGLIGGKKTFVTVHMGDSQDGIAKIKQVLASQMLAPSMFALTHVGRKEHLWKECLEFAQTGGIIDISTDNNFKPISELISEVISLNLLDYTSISSDGNGSYSSYDKDGNLLEIGAARCDGVLRTLKMLVKDKVCDLSSAIRLASTSPAHACGLNAGCIKAGAKADLIALDGGYELQSVMIRGRLFMHEGSLLVKDFFN